MLPRSLPPIAAHWPPQVEEVTYLRHGRTAVIYVEIAAHLRRP